MKMFDFEKSKVVIFWDRGSSIYDIIVKTCSSNSIGKVINN